LQILKLSHQQKKPEKQRKPENQRKPEKREREKKKEGICIDWTHQIVFLFLIFYDFI